MAAHVLDNIVWHCLAGPHAHLAAGTPAARRYARGFSPILGFASLEAPALEAIAPFCETGEHLYCAGWTGHAPAGWTIDADATGQQYVWAAPPPAADDSLAATRLGPSDVAQMVALAERMRPGPFAARTHELGCYYGVFDGGRLVAMAGERMAAGPFREISGVCTHPDFQGRGHARRLVARLVREEIARGETPILHVMKDNAPARRVYERMGFRHHQDVQIRVVSRAG